MDTIFLQPTPIANIIKEEPQTPPPAETSSTKSNSQWAGILLDRYEKIDCSQETVTLHQVVKEEKCEVLPSTECGGPLSLGGLSGVLMQPGTEYWSPAAPHAAAAHQHPQSVGAETEVRRNDLMKRHKDIREFF